MKAIQFHLKALGNTFASLAKGKYLLFFLPGIIIGIIFWQLFSVFDSAEESVSAVESVPFLGSFVKGTFGAIDFILESIFVFFILTVLSPFNTILSEKIDSDVTGKKYPFDLFQILSDLIRMIFIVIIAIILELLFMGIYYIISAILNLDFLDETMFFLIAALFYGFSFYDYSLERNKMGISSSIGFTFKNMLTVTLTGCIFSALYKIPYVGVIIAPVLTTMISTHVYILNQNKNVSLNQA